MSENLLPKADAAAIDAQHKVGKMTARERVDKLLDLNSFVEIGRYVQHNSAEFGVDKQAPGDGVVAGYGTVDMRPVYVYAQDFTAFHGSLGAKNAEKIAKVYEMAVKNGVPVVSILDSAGARLQDGMAALDGYAKVMKCAAQASGVVPQIALVAGPCIGSNALIAQLADFVFVVEKTGTISVNGAQILASMTGNDITPQSLGGADAAMDSGLADFVCANEEQALVSMRNLLNILPGNNMEDAPYALETQDDFNRSAVVGEDIDASVASIVDNGSLVEVKAGYGKGMLTALAALGGKAVGIIANRGKVDEGRLDLYGCAKAAGFLRFCDSFSIPVVSFLDTAGFALSVQQEENGLAKEIAGLAYAYAEATVPLISVVAGKAVGGAYAVMGSHGIGADMVYAYPDAVIAPLNAEAAVEILDEALLRKADNPVARRQELEEEY
ncbi:MAG: acyl-CoA carboxylase subunit beta, partial [Christensenellales bacterium]